MAAEHNLLALSMITQLARMFVRYFRFYRGYAGHQIYVIVGLSLLMGYAEGLGIAMIFPLFQGEGAAAADSVSQSLSKIFSTLGIPTTPEGALPLLAAAFALKGVLSFVAMSYQARSTAHVGRKLRMRMIDTLTATDYLVITRSNTGFLANLFNAEITRAAKAFLYFTRALAPAVNVIVFFGIVVFLDWVMTLACIAMALIAVLVVRVSGRIARRTSDVTAAESASLTALLIQMVHGFKYLRATGLFRRFKDRIERSSDRLTRADRESGSAAALVASVTQPLMVLFLVALLYYRAVIQGESVAALFVLLAYFLRIMTEIVILQTQWQTFLASAGSVDVVEDTLANHAKQAEPRGTKPFIGLTKTLAASHVSFAYSAERNVLRDVSLSIERCSTVAFVGDSGSGKTTLVDLLSGTLRPSAGQILIDGVDLAEIDVESYRQRIGYVPQESVLFDDTVANNITMWSDYPHEQIVEAARRAKCLEFIEAMPGGFAAPIGDRGVQLSGGQRQRLAIARELLKQPDLLVLDEATSALDSDSERAIKQSIDELRGEMTILIIAHRLSTVRNCDYVYVLFEGEIVEHGRHDDLLARPGSRFRRMCELQNATVTPPA
jgi:ABC-type multidrug transport system fused ATPase/permease subunit